MIRKLFATVSLMLALPATAQPRAPLVLAASSLQEAMTAAADAWAKRGHPRPTISFAASSALARQAMAGVPADLFASADEEWMDALAKRNLLAVGTRADLVGNRLVVVGAKSAPPLVMSTAGLRTALGHGPLAMADPSSVPAGKYGQAALMRFGVWPTLAPRVVRAENVRAALALVERGAAPFGIVYATDAQAATGVRVVGTFPPASHPPIRYPLARLKSSRNVDAERFRRFLLSSAGKSIFARYGFLTR